MEPISLTQGTVGLVGTFKACVDCFNYIRVGRNLGKDYEKCIIKLELAHLRFTRWGESVGINEGDDTVAVSTLRTKLKVSDTQLELVKKTLGQILDSFETATKLSQRQKLRNKKSAAVDENETVSDMAHSDLRLLHMKIKELAIRRQKESTVSQKVKWALYRKGDFTDLLVDLTGFVTSLVSLVPAAEMAQQRLCEEEIREINDDQNMVLLNQILKEPIAESCVQDNDEADNEGDCLLDGILQRKVAEAISTRGDHISKIEWIENTVDDGSSIHQGTCLANDYKGEILPEEIRHLRVLRSKFGKNVKFSQGNFYGNK